MREPTGSSASGVSGADEEGRAAAALFEALAPPLDPGHVEEAVPELGLARGVGQGDFHHLDTEGHILQTIREVERELEERALGATVPAGRRAGMRLVGLLHDIAKPLTRGEIEGRVLFVAHDTLGARYAYRICRRLGVSAGETDLAVTLTALHLKIGFMSNPRSDYPPERLALAAGPFTEELAVLSWADRLAAQGPRLKQEHIERHRELCSEFLRSSREYRVAGEMPDYAALTEKPGIGGGSDADAGYAAANLRLLRARGLGEKEATTQAAAMLPGTP